MPITVTGITKFSIALNQSKLTNNLEDFKLKSYDGTDIAIPRAILKMKKDEVESVEKTSGEVNSFILESGLRLKMAYITDFRYQVRLEAEMKLDFQQQ